MRLSEKIDERRDVFGGTDPGTDQGAVGAPSHRPRSDGRAAQAENDPAADRPTTPWYSNDLRLQGKLPDKSRISPPNVNLLEYSAASLEIPPLTTATG